MWESGEAEAILILLLAEKTLLLETRDANDSITLEKRALSTRFAFMGEC